MLESFRSDYATVSVDRIHITPISTERQALYSQRDLEGLSFQLFIYNICLNPAPLPRLDDNATKTVD